MIPKLSNDFIKLTLSGAKSKGAASRIIMRPINLKGARKIQVEEFIGAQAFHKNMDVAAAEKYLAKLSRLYANLNITRGQADLAHDRRKNHILADGVLCPPLVKLGIMDESGRVFKSKMDKFIQINNFLRILGDAVKNIKKDGVLEVLDFCSGKSYLAFALQYFFQEILKRPAHIVGIDSKADVIAKCSEIGEELGTDNIDLIAGDINDFKPDRPIDIALSLHACDTLTDVVLKKAVAAGATVILAVPCCHKQLAKTVANKDLDFMLKYGLLKERFAAILTDALRANWLESKGYIVDILEFVDFNNSPKNIMIRAVKSDKRKVGDLSPIVDRFNVLPEIFHDAV